MAIYRPTKPRYKTLLLTGAVGVAAGLVLGLLLGGGDPAPEEAAREVRVSLSEAASVLEIVQIEYSEATEGGGGEQELEGARDALARSRTLWRDARATFLVLDPDRAEEIDALYDDLANSLDSGSTPDEVDAAVDQLSAALEPSDS